MRGSRRRSSPTDAFRTRCCSKFSPPGVRARSFTAKTDAIDLSAGDLALYFMFLDILSLLLNILWWIIIVQAVMSCLIAFNVIIKIGRASCRERVGMYVYILAVAVQLKKKKTRKTTQKKN